MRGTPAAALVAAGVVLVTAWPAPVVAAPSTNEDSTATVTAAAKPAKPRAVSVLYALTASSGTFTPVQGKKRVYTLTLRRTSDQVTWFTDRPVRESGFLPTIGFVRGWAGYGFDEDPPNVALVVRDTSGGTDTVVATMTHPRVTKGVLTARLTSGPPRRTEPPTESRRRWGNGSKKPLRDPASTSRPPAPTPSNLPPHR
jgi:hypothetical protein